MVAQLHVFAATTFAQATGWRAMGSRFRDGGSSFDPTTLILALAAVGALVLLLWLTSKFLTSDGERPYHGPLRLFLQLCQAHQLGVHESWLLWRVARAHGLRQPAELFVDADRFAPASLPATLRRHQKQLSALRLRLFGPGDDATSGNQ